ncbi:TPA: hypothetical protein RG395_003226 [Legionella pneumophila]|nr:hypothetical protein [Legionella pneumophila]HAU1208509.1 hypothetical protein [Legionella pneumophila]HAU1285072.1 hypothetical protein [Legionella pneumophila]HBC2758537.1 hypothetical protein [Legionella pneumophila]HCQ3578329.1 hypothetical protein [Legionella pneumophila]
MNTFLTLLNTPDLTSVIEESLRHHRKRIYPASATLSMYLTQTLHSDSSCQNIVNIVAIDRLNAGQRLGNTYTGGYCRARQRLPIKMVSNLSHCRSDLPIKWYDFKCCYWTIQRKRRE